jgi:hypothetical protein
MAKDAGSGFMDFGWGIWGAIIGSVVFVALFLGPGMWSSSTDFLFVTLWRQWRERRQAKHGEQPGERGSTGDPTNQSAK